MNVFHFESLKAWGFVSAQGEKKFCECKDQKSSGFIWSLCFNEPYLNVDFPQKLIFSSSWIFLIYTAQCYG